MEKKTILVVEDEKAIADILVFNLQREGYDTIVAYDGTEGLRHALEDAPDLILLHARADGARQNQYAPHGVGRGTGKSALAVRRRAAYFQGQRHGVQKRASAGAVGA